MKFHVLTSLEMFVDTLIHGFQIMCNITKVIKVLLKWIMKYFVGILNLGIALLTTYTK